MSKPKTLPNRERVECPRCHGQTTHRNGYNFRTGGEIIQRWYCQRCDKSFQACK
ncbi:hypothetical protein I8751_13225 [Nostocaceae cyanobacterium CENA357]|uniref:Uncharacterized protein n=1 Tax=Atlanticothrix silvestris CENA357 TaxID=1725252 RepID=A0A8J7HEC5_9CYAN|nr:hypothetical protein [Atlanticothrix silvestris]MBH8553318.1 hypothetical protein [Atlanticothrix silvestris CENA357]